MMVSYDAAVLKELQRIPGVGKTVAKDLYRLGFHSVSSLKSQDPQQLYEDHCIEMGCQVDRCMLYTFRCAVYFATEENPDPSLLKWWAWKDPAPVWPIP